MAENIELIAAKDLPTTEAEEVSVLCIDNGELKQKPGASFGGGGYITVADSIDVENAMALINESYDNFIGTLLAGGTVWVDLTSAMGMTARALAVMWGFRDGAFILAGNAGGIELTFTCPNGTWTPEG